MPEDDKKVKNEVFKLTPHSPLFVNIGDLLVVDGRTATAGIQVSTVTGGAPDASDPLPEGTIILSP